MFQHETAHALHSILLFDTIYCMYTQYTLIVFQRETCLTTQRLMVVIPHTAEPPAPPW